MPFERAKGIFIVTFVKAGWYMHQAVHFQLSFDHFHEYSAEKAAFLLLFFRFSRFPSSLIE